MADDMTLYETKFKTQKGTYSVVFKAHDDIEAQDKLNTVKDMLTRSFFKNDIETDFLKFCANKYDGEKVKHYESIGKIFSPEDALSILSEIHVTDALNDKLKHKPISTLTKGILKSPFKAPAIMFKSINSDFGEILGQAMGVLRFSRKAYEKKLEEKDFVVINGEKRQIEKVINVSNFSPLNFAMGISLSVFVTIFAFSDLNLPSVVFHILKLFALILWLATAQQFTYLINTKKRQPNGTRR